MSVPSTQLQMAQNTAKSLENQGYFARAHAGDQMAASLFVRLLAYTLNPSGAGSGFGCLSKSPGESQVDGFSEDAICYGDNPADLQNVVDMISGAGAPGATIPDPPGVKERRPNNKWVKPAPLSQAQLAFLRSGETPGQPPAYPPYPGDEPFDALGAVLFADYARAGQAPNPGMSRWFGRTEYDWLTGICPSLQASIDKHRKEWCAILGIPVQ